jgi:hypothetical protein
MLRVHGAAPAGPRPARGSRRLSRVARPLNRVRDVLLRNGTAGRGGPEPSHARSGQNLLVASQDAGSFSREGLVGSPLEVDSMMPAGNGPVRRMMLTSFAGGPLAMPRANRPPKGSFSRG